MSDIAQTTPKAVCQLVITQFDNGQIQVSGPLHDKIRSYGLIEVARETIAKQDRPPEAPIVLPIRQNGFHIRK